MSNFVSKGKSKEKSNMIVIEKYRRYYENFGYCKKT